MASTFCPFNGYSVKFSPFRKNLIGVASSQYYGIAGNGRVTIMDIESPESRATPGGGSSMRTVCEFVTKDGCFDIAWSEKSDQIIAAATGDGSVKIFSSNHPGGRPVGVLTGHTAETYSVDWNIYSKDMICSASWDRSVCVWDVMVGQRVQVIRDHSSIVYEAKWNPRVDKLLASVGGDGMLNMYDVSAGRSVSRISGAHGNEILCLDFNKYRDHIIATGSVDRSIKVWDLRNPGTCIQTFTGHDLAVRRVKFSPHSETILASCSYDMTCRVWSTGHGGLIDTLDHHTEFVIGIDFSNFSRDLIASTAWDRRVCLWTAGATRPPGPHRQQPKRIPRLIRQSAA
jgi:peroxin-7